MFKSWVNQGEPFCEAPFNFYGCTFPESEYFLSCQRHKKLSRAVKQKEKRWGNCRWSWNEIFFAGTTFDVYMFVKTRRSSCMQNRRGTRNGVKRRTRKSLYGKPHSRKQEHTNQCLWMGSLLNKRELPFLSQVFLPTGSGNDHFSGTVIFRLMKLKIGIGDNLSTKHRERPRAETMNLQVAVLIVNCFQNGLLLYRRWIYICLCKNCLHLQGPDDAWTRVQNNS